MEQTADDVGCVGLHYVSGRKKGLSRRRCGRGFAYYNPSGKLIGDGRVRERIAGLAIPPAWDGVWICPDPLGHLQASGNDARGRRQYIYHPLFRAMRDVAKFERLGEFALTLPRIRRKVRQHLSLRGLPRKKVLAAIARLLDESYIRIGNERYEKQNASFGITTIRSKHVVVKRDSFRLRFPGKGAKEQEMEISDARLARVLKRCDELPGRRLFQYRENGTQGGVDSGDVNEYLAEVSGKHVTAKDFRTWGGTIAAAQRLLELGPAETEFKRRRSIHEAYKQAAQVLGNTPSICHKYYVHPAVTLAYEEGVLQRRMQSGGSQPVAGLRKIERGVLAVLKHSSDEAFRRWIADVEAA